MTFSKHLLAAGAALVVCGSAFAASPSDAGSGTIWLGTELSYESPVVSNLSFELGAGFYGVGGGVDFYPGGKKNGLMFSGRFGSFGSGYAVNAEANLVGDLGRSARWRIGAGVEYISVDFDIGDPFGSGSQLSINARGVIPGD